MKKKAKYFSRRRGLTLWFPKKERKRVLLI